MFTSSTQRTTRPFISAAALLALAAGAAAACPTPHTISIASPGFNDEAGAALAWSGASLMIGVPGRDAAAANAGAVYTFLPGGFTWTQRAEILAADAAPGDGFGAAVAFADPYAAIGAPGRGDTGSVYFFERTGNTWNQVTRVSATSEPGADVGRVLAISGSTVAIGVPKKTIGQHPGAGAVYLYQRNVNGTWGFAQQLNEDPALEPIAGDRFGEAVALHGDLLVVGVPTGEDTPAFTDHGYARVYRRGGDGFTHEQRLAMPAPVANARFGAAVATDGEFIAVGAPWRGRLASEGGELPAAGAVYVYRFDGGQWVADGVVFAPDAAAYAAFGDSVELRAGRLVVGSPESKKAYIFRRIPSGVWHPGAVLTDPTGANNSGFARAIAFNGDQVAVGAPADAGFGPTGGRTFIYNRPNFDHGDDCIAAVPVSQGVYTGCTDGATLDGSAACGGPANAQGPDVWFSWTSPCSGTLHVDTVGSAFDTVLSVHSGCPGAPGSTQIACSNDAPGLGSASRVQFNYQAGQVYYIRLGGADGASGDYTLNVTDGDGEPPANNDCATPQVVTDGVFAFGTCRAGGGFPTISGCSPSGAISLGHDVWFRYTAPSTGTATIDLCGSNFPAAVAVYNLGRCPGLIDQPVACDTGSCPGGQARVEFAIVEGSEYLIRVGSLPGAAGGSAVMSIASGSACPADWNGDGSVNSNDISAFLTSWLDSVQAGTLGADFSGDGAVNSNDISAFLTAWLGAVQNGC